MPAHPKYRKKFAKELLNGLRKQGWIIEECCAHWGVVRTSYNNWREKYPEFEAAHQAGERDYKCWWMNEYRDVATGKKPGNAAMMNLTAKNVLGFVDKQEVHNTHEEKLTTIKIEMLPPREAQRIGNIIDGEVCNSKLDSIPS